MSEKKNMKHIYLIEDLPPGYDHKATWTKIGAAFENRDGSWHLDLSAVPVRGRLQMRDPFPERERPRGENGTIPPTAVNGSSPPHAANGPANGTPPATAPKANGRAAAGAVA